MGALVRPREQILRVVASMLVLSACGSCSAETSWSPGSREPSAGTLPGGLVGLREQIAAGSDCPDLFAVFDGIPEGSPDFGVAQGELINIGCYTRDSTRNDGDEQASGPWRGVPGERVTPASACSSSAEAAAAETDATAAEPLISATLDACTTVSEWMSAIQDHPGVMGMADGFIPQLLDLQTVCYSYPDTAVCRDAVALGLDVGP